MMRRESIAVGALCSSSESVTTQVPGSAIGSLYLSAQAMRNLNDHSLPAPPVSPGVDRGVRATHLAR